jgi:alpha-amylase/alpha-mannosidase (GH57 family)
MEKSNKYICIHGHFYQPPRENAWLEIVEKQDSAEPFHDWNERINFECYAPNTAARIQKGDKITKIVNNYERISFNFGPTLLSWMEKADRTTYESIIDADIRSRKKFDGHGSAMAQAYSHMILPLANARDKDTQVIWGIKDFENRFGRKPKGMWLAETAVDTASLEVMAEHGIEFSVLAPRQAKAYRKLGDENWKNLGHAEVDPRRPYLCKLPSGKSIALFFYDGNIAQDVAFKGILNNGKHFANRLVSTFDDDDSPQIMNVATDGESYGHHHSHGEMALAYCLNYIEENNLATIINYSAYLEKFPPQHEIQIHENSSWSCVHGVERWRSNCGCRADVNNGWSQEWRKPLRELLNWLRDELIPIYETEAAHLIVAPWEARNEYIDVILNRNEQYTKAFLEKYATKSLTEHEVSKVFRLLEMQRNAILMFTSCAWFFDEISGLETNQVLQYALRAIHYARQVSGIDLHPEFEKRLEKIHSNVFENGAISYRDVVLPTRLDLERVGMHYACASLFEPNPDDLSLFNYTIENEFFERIIAGNHRLVIGRTTVKSKITLSRKAFSFAVLYLGQQNIIGNLSTKMPGAVFQEMHDQISQRFRETDLGESYWFDANLFCVRKILDLASV